MMFRIKGVIGTIGRETPNTISHVIDDIKQTLLNHVF